MFDWLLKREDMQGGSPWSAGHSGLLITGYDGFLGGTHVVSNLGWRQVDALCVGDQVLTFDNGMRSIIEIQRETIRPAESPLPQQLWPVLVPEGALLNRREMRVAPEQGIFIESDLVSDAQGDPYAIVPGRSLVGFREIHQVKPGDKMTLTTLAFAHDEVVYAEGGMLVYCPKARQILADELDDNALPYNVLPFGEAKVLMRRLTGAEAPSQIGWRSDEIAAHTSLRAARPG
ncbi:MAG: Hint domain-containing protein [Paracoccaceae bacterium]